jgi:hypothetical protein
MATTALSVDEAVRQMRNPFAGKRGTVARPRAWFDWEGARKSSKDIREFRSSLIAALRTLPKAQRAQELDGLLREVEPEFADMVLSETQHLVQDGHPAERALEAALGAVLAARRKKHWWVILNVIVPFQARKVAEGIYAATSDSKERAKRIDLLIQTLRPARPLPYIKSEARQRLKELGVSSREVESILTGRRVTAHDVASRLERLLRDGVPPKEALRRALIVAMKAYTVEQFKSHPVAEGVEFCIWGAVVSGALALVGAIVGIAQPLAAAEHARREAVRATNRQRVSPLSPGEIEQIIAGVLRSGATTWGAPQRQAALDYIRVARFSRAAFVAPEESQLQTAFTTARNAIVAQEQAIQRAKDTKVMVGVGLGLTALVGVAVIYRRSR